VMSESADMAQWRVAYIDTVRNLHKRERHIAMAGCLLGVLLMAAGGFMEGAPSWLRWAGLAVIAPSWALFVYVVVSRTRYVRAHPFDPGS